MRLEYSSFSVQFVSKPNLLLDVVHLEDLSVRYHYHTIFLRENLQNKILAYLRGPSVVLTDQWHDPHTSQTQGMFPNGLRFPTFSGRAM